MRHFLRLFLILAYGCGSAAPEIEPISAAKAIGPSSAAPIDWAERDWPQWRGVTQTGVIGSAAIPNSWSEAENVTWKQSVPGRGHSSPIVVHERVFLTTADELNQKQLLLCYSVQDGAKLWEQTVNSGGFPRKHPKNSFASATPASDGKLIFVAFVNHDRLQVASYDLDGNQVWDKQAGPFQSEHGYGQSPTIFENLVIVAGDSRGAGFLAGLDRASGEIVWRATRDAPAGHANYSSPVVAQLAGKPQLIQLGFLKTISYDPATGKELWQVPGPSTVAANSVAYKDPYVVVSGGYSEKEILCIDAASSQVVWTSSKNVAYVPSPIIDGDRVLVAADNGGTLAGFDLESGEETFRGRLGGNFSATPIKIDERFFVPNEDGTVYVFQTQPKFKVLAENTLDDSGGMSSLVVSGDSLFIRTGSALYKINDPVGESSTRSSENASSTSTESVSVNGELSSK